MSEKEIWKPIEGFEGIYEVSNSGRVRSWRKYLNKLNGTVPWILEAKTRRGKYKESLTVYLYRGCLMSSFNITKNLPKYFPEIKQSYLS